MLVNIYLRCYYIPDLKEILDQSYPCYPPLPPHHNVPFQTPLSHSSQHPSSRISSSDLFYSLLSPMTTFSALVLTSLAALPLFLMKETKKTKESQHIRKHEV